MRVGFNGSSARGQESKKARISGLSCKQIKFNQILFKEDFNAPKTNKTKEREEGQVELGGLEPPVSRVRF